MNTNTPATARPKVRSLMIGGLLALTAIGGTAVVGTGSAGAIVSGEATSISTTPWQVSIQNEFGHFCGGTLVNPTTVVSAAHCFEGETTRNVTVRAGVTDSDDSSGQDSKVTSIVSHPDYARQEVGDIAVLTLATPMRETSTVKPIGLASRDELDAATTATVSGWGALSEQGAESIDQLRSATVPLVSDQTCVPTLGIDAAGEVCAGGTGTDTCYGDSGGPLVINTPNGPKLGGVTSWGEECGGQTPGVYTEVPNYLNFITGSQEQASEAPAEPDTTPAVADEPPVDEFDDEYLDDDFAESEFDDDFAEFDDAEFDDIGDWTIEVFVDGDWFEIDTTDWSDSDWELIDNSIQFD